MTSEERQRVIRQAGSKPAEAEKEEGARESRERARAEEGGPDAHEQPPSEESTPLPEDPEDPKEPPRPRR